VTIASVKAGKQPPKTGKQDFNFLPKTDRNLVFANYWAIGVPTGEILYFNNISTGPDRSFVKKSDTLSG